MARFEAAAVALSLAALSACAIPSRAELTRGRSGDAELPDANLPDAEADSPDVPVDRGPDAASVDAGDGALTPDPQVPPPDDGGAFDPCATHTLVELSFAEPDLDASLCWVDLSGGGTLTQVEDDAGAGLFAETPFLTADAVARARGAVVLWKKEEDSEPPFPSHVRVRATVDLHVPGPGAIADRVEWLKLQADVGDDTLMPGVGLLLWGEGHKTAGLVVDNIDTPGEPSADDLMFRDFQTVPSDAYVIDLDVRFGAPGSITLSVNGEGVPDVTGSYTVEASPRASSLFLLLGLDSHGSAAAGVVYRDLVVTVE
jgi:hypothetical protein